MHRTSQSEGKGPGKPVPCVPPGCLLFSWRMLAPCQESTTRASSVVQTGFALEDAKGRSCSMGQGPAAVISAAVLIWTARGGGVQHFL